MRNIDNQSFNYKYRYSSLPAGSPDRFSSFSRPRAQQSRFKHKPKNDQDYLDLGLLKIGAMTAIVTVVITITLILS